jgi:hypothetical protein
MSYRLSQLSPQTSPRGSNLRVVVASPYGVPPANLGNVQFWRSWLELDSEIEPRPKSRVNWNAVLGLAVAAGISLGFWMGVTLLILQIWK